MYTFLLLLHVLAAVFLTGPLVIAPMTALRGLRAGDARTVRAATRQTTIYGLASLVVFGLGAAVVPTRPTEYTFSTPWVIISMTLYILAMLVVLLVVIPALNSTANLLTPGLMPATRDDDSAEPDADKTPDGQPDLYRAAGSTLVPLADQEPEVRHKLDALRGRITAGSGIVAGLMIVTTAMMVVKPFGQ
jgi:hypothetical protein